ncbi:unnamed protein product [Ambrosiozyma monospora]|uniref:Unnamed protein product n=1 Tax=Ambrosiozyma monospora TaxID=43982 RepID=A0ACB5SW91_AMBMO|nr:unnamed protein product [Ambrosiozyma monospora]
MTEEIEVESTYTLEQLRDALCNKSGDVKLTNRFRALFYLKSIGSEFETDPERAHKAIHYIAECFADDSELLKHEVAYVLGQTKNLEAIPVLNNVLDDSNQQCMVRHEAAEALGAIGNIESLPILEKYYKDPKESVPIKETCELAIDRIKWSNSQQSKTEKLETSLYESIDPAPPMPTGANDKVDKLKETLNDTSKPLFERYRAMFRLRDIGTDDAVMALASVCLL